MPYNAGTAYLQVVPSFWDIQKAFENEAAKLGAEIDRALSKSIPEGMRDGARQASKEGERAGRSYAGALGEALRRRVDGALQAIKPVKVDADTTAAELKFAIMREELEELRDAKIGIDIDEHDLFSELARMQAILDEIEHDGATIEIRHNARQVRAELEALQHIAEEDFGFRTQGSRDGAVFGGAFATSAKTAIRGALENLPEVHLNADSTDIDREIAAIRVRLAELGDEEIGVDIDAATFLAELELIQRRINALSGQEIRIDVHTNLLSALAQLGTLSTAISNLNNQDSGGWLNRIGQSAEFSMSRLGFLISLGVSIGPAIVPAAAAAAVAISAIGTAAAAAVIGVGVLGLGLFGSIKAVGLLDKAQKDSSKSAVSLSGAENRVATALGQAASAQRGLERAERDRRKAVEALVKAQEEARRQLEDMAISVESNALAQRQARLDEAEAKRELDALLANPRATNEEREQARITHEQKVLQLKQLGLEQTRLAADKDEADKKGVQGSDKVVAAQERILDATDAVISAQESVASSQRAMAAAYEKTGVAGGAAMQNLQEAMDGLSPSGKRFALFLFGLKDELQSLQHTAEGGLLPGLERSITNLLPALPRVEQLVGSVARALGEEFDDLTGGLDDPQWREFFGFIEETAVPSLRGLFTVTSNGARGLASLLVALSPFNGKIGGGLIEFSEDFAKWAGQLSQTAGFQKFLAYVERTGPKVVDVIEQIAIFSFRLLVAAAPIGEVVLHVFDSLFRGINAIPIPVLTVILGLIGALSIVLIGSAAASRVFVIAQTLADAAMKAWAVGLRIYNVVLLQYQTQMAVATVRTGQFGGALTIATAATGAARLGLSSMITMLGGPWGLALAAATFGLVQFIQKQEEFRANAGRMTDSITQVATAFDDGGDVAVDGLARQNHEVAKLMVTLQAFGVTSKDVWQAQEGDIVKQEKVLEAMRNRVLALKKQYEQEAAANDTIWHMIIGSIPEGEKETLEELTGLEGAVAELEKRYKLAKIAVDAYGDSTGDVAIQTRRTSIASDLYGSKIENLQRAYDILTAKTWDASAAAQALRIYTEATTGAAIDATEAEEANARGLIDLRDALRESGAEFDLNKAQSDEHRKSILGSRDALEEALRATREKTLADIEAKVPIEEATRAGEERIEAILAEIPATERNSSVVQGLVDAYGRIPKEVATNVRVEGAAAVLAQLKDLKVAQYALEHNVGIDAARRAVFGGQATFEQQVPRSGWAKGGYISGPGGPTEDKIPAWLSDGEYVIPAHIVAGLGRNFFDELIGFRRRGSGGGVPGFAQGGLVMWPFPVNAAMTKMPYTMADLQAKFGVAGALSGFPPWPSSPAASRGDSGVWRGILNLLNVAKVPYSFGNAYRHGDPLWHGSGRAVDLMGFNQDRLGGFFMDMKARVLELIHTTNAAGYYVTRGRKKSSMGDQDELHRNHLHVAMDSGGWLMPGYTSVWNGTGAPEPVLTSQQWADINVMARGGDGAGVNHYNFQFADTTLTPGKLRAMQDHDAAVARQRRAR